MSDLPNEPALEEELDLEEGAPSGEPQETEQVVEPEEPEGVEPPTGEPEAPEAEAEPKPPSRREQLRIQQLLEKYGKPEPTPQLPPAPGINYEQELDADPETIKRLQADRDAAAKAMYEYGLQQSNSIQFHTRLEIDAPRVETKYPTLNKESEEFNPAFANAVNTWYLNMVGYDPQTNSVRNPNIRYADFVEGFMELVDEGASVRSETTRKNVTKQAAQTSLRPDGSASKGMNLNKAPQDMSEDELKAVINASLPTK